MPESLPLEKLLVCPETRMPLARAGKDVLDSINQKIQSKSLRKKNGDTIDSALSDGLIRSDGKVFYPILDGIPIMLIEESIPLG